MKKGIILIVVLALVIGGGITYFIATHPQGLSSSAGNKLDTSASSVGACDILTEAVAKQVLGGTVTQPGGSAGNTSSPDVTISNCLYTASTTDTTKTNGVSVLARVARTVDSVSLNKAQFADMPVGVQSVSGIGDRAYYDPSFHQLNVLKGGNWYIVTSYVGSPSSATLDTDKKLAGLLNFK